MDFSERAVTLVLVNTAAFLEKADEALLPAVYMHVGKDLGVLPLSIGHLAVYRALAQALVSPLTAYLSLHISRIQIIALGTIWWGTATFTVGNCTTFGLLALGQAASGAGLAVVLPAAQALVADLYPEENRGLGFGILQTAGYAGGIWGGLLAAEFAGLPWGGVSGWRGGFLVFGIVSILFGLLVYRFGEDPKYPGGAGLARLESSIGTSDGKAMLRSPDRKGWPDLRDVWPDICQVAAIRSFRVIVAQGVVADLCVHAFLVIPFWLELIGFSPSQIAAQVAFLPLGSMAGSLCGGYFGDWLSLKLPEIGRILTAQGSLGLCLPLAAVLFHALPENLKLGAVYSVAFFLLGFFASWSTPACDWPILSEVVPVRLRTAAFALERCLQKSAATAIAPLVALMTINLQHLRIYSSPPPAPLPSSRNKTVGVKTAQPAMAPTSPLSQQRLQAKWLARCLFVAVGLPIVTCVAMVTWLYWTYPSERRRAKIENWIVASEEAFGEGQLETGTVSLEMACMEQEEVERRKRRWRRERREMMEVGEVVSEGEACEKQEGMEGNMEIGRPLLTWRSVGMEPAWLLPSGGSSTNSNSSSKFCKDSEDGPFPDVADLDALERPYSDEEIGN